MQAHYFLIPPSGARFHDDLERWLHRVPGAFRHPDLRERAWVLTASDDMARWLEAKLRLEPHTSLVSQGLVVLHASAIEVYQDTSAEVLRAMQGLVTRILSTWSCQVLSEEGEDWTVRYAEHPEDLFREEEAWDGRGSSTPDAKS